MTIATQQATILAAADTAGADDPKWGVIRPAEPVTGYAVNLAGKARHHLTTLDDIDMAKARARSEAKRHRQATEVIDRATRAIVYRVGFGKR